MDGNTIKVDPCIINPFCEFLTVLISFFFLLGHHY